MKMYSRVLAASAIAVASFGTSALAANDVVKERYTDIATVTSKPVTANQVRSALMSCGLSASRGWQFTKAGSGKLVGKIVVRSKHVVEVDVVYSSKAYKITYLDSTNMNYDAEKNTIHRRYNSWVENLDNDTQVCLKALVR